MKRVLRIAAIAIAIVIAIFLMLLVYGVYLIRQKNPPLTQLDTGGHMAKIGSLAFTPDGKFLVWPATTRRSASGTPAPARRCAPSGAGRGWVWRAKSTPWRCRRMGAGSRWADG